MMSASGQSRRLGERIVVSGPSPKADVAVGVRRYGHRLIYIDTDLITTCGEVRRQREARSPSHALVLRHPPVTTPLHSAASPRSNLAIKAASASGCSWVVR